MIGFGDFAELNAMFTLQDLRMLFTFMGAVAVAGALFYTFTKDHRYTVASFPERCYSAPAGPFPAAVLRFPSSSSVPVTSQL